MTGRLASATGTPDQTSAIGRVCESPVNRFPIQLRLRHWALAICFPGLAAWEPGGVEPNKCLNPYEMLRLEGAWFVLGAAP